LISGISTSGVGVGIVIIPMMASRVMEGFGWRISLVVIGVILLVMIVPLGQLLKSAPQNGKLAGKREDSPKAVTESVKGIPFSQAIKTAPFWMISIAWLLFGFFYHTAIVHLVPYATDLGMSAVSAATILTVIGV